MGTVSFGGYQMAQGKQGLQWKSKESVW
jgi:hypothetical protein